MRARTELTAQVNRALSRQCPLCKRKVEFTVLERGFFHNPSFRCPACEAEWELLDVKSPEQPELLSARLKKAGRLPPLGNLPRGFLQLKDWRLVADTKPEEAEAPLELGGGPGSTPPLPLFRRYSVFDIGVDYPRELTAILWKGSERSLGEVRFVDMAGLDGKPWASLRFTVQWRPLRRLLGRFPNPTLIAEYSVRKLKASGKVSFIAVHDSRAQKIFGHESSVTHLKLVWKPVLSDAPVGTPGALDSRFAHIYCGNTERLILVQCTTPEKWAPSNLQIFNHALNSLRCH